MDGADPRARQHRCGDLGDHRQIDRHSVALLDAALFQHIREPANRFVQFAVGDPAVLGGIVALPQDCRLVAAPRQKAIDAVIAGVESSVLVPGNTHIAVERCVFCSGIWLDPVEPFPVLAPKSIGIVERVLIEFVIIGFADLRPFQDGPRSGSRSGSTWRNFLLGGGAGRSGAQCCRRLFRDAGCLQNPRQDRYGRCAEVTAAAGRKQRRLRPVGHVEAADDLFHMRFDRTLGHSQRVGDQLIRPAFGN